MRNLCFAAALAEQHSQQHAYGFLLAYAGAAESAGETAAAFEAFRVMLLAEVEPARGLDHVRGIASTVWQEGQNALAQWIETRLREGVAARTATSSRDS
jgi:hypothetical protein